MFRANSKVEILPSSNPSSSPSKRLLSSKPSRRKRSRSSSRLPPAIYDILYTYPASFRHLIVLLVIGSLLFWISTNLLVLVRFVFIDKLFSIGLFGKTHLALRKPPLVFIHSPWSVSIVWETNQNRTEDGLHQKGVGLRYWKTHPVGVLPTGSNKFEKASSSLKLPDPISTEIFVPTVEVAQPHGKGGANRWVHSVLLEDLKPGYHYAYELFLESTSSDPHHPRIPLALKIYGSYEFPWLGMDSPDPANVEHISQISPTANRTVSNIHIAIIGDTYANPRALHTLAKSYLDLKSYMPSSTSSFRLRRINQISGLEQPTKPHTLIHLGNVVSDPEDHQQWQTRFWDPLTFQLPASSEVPILQARGPHDFDTSGLSIYTGGLPSVQLGEVNRTRVALLKNQKDRIILPGFAVAERQYTAIQSIKRDRRTRASFIGYSPHPRIRILVLDPNLVPERQAFIGSKSSLTELGDHEHWLLWEMARPEWKEASIRIIVVNVSPFPEYDDPHSWAENYQNNWDTYVRINFGPHFHATSSIAQRFDIPPATIVVSTQPEAYYRGLLQNFIASEFTSAISPDKINAQYKKVSRDEHYTTSEPSSPDVERGVIYVSVPGQRAIGSGAHMEERENWGFYEIASDFSHRKRKINLFSSLSFDLSPDDGYATHEEMKIDWDENITRRKEWDRESVRLYHSTGSQLVCERSHAHPNQVQNEKEKSGSKSRLYGLAYDRVYWRTMSSKGQVIDRFVIEAAACRTT